MISPVSAVYTSPFALDRQVNRQGAWLCHGEEQLASVHEAFQSLIR